MAHRNVTGFTLLWTFVVSWFALCSFASATQPADDGAFVGAQWVMSSSAARAISLVGVRAATQDDVLGKIIRKKQNQEAVLKGLRAAYLKAVTKKSGEAFALRRKISSVKSALRTIDDTLETKFPSYSEIANPRPLSILDVQKHLAPGESMLITLTGEQAIYVWVISTTQARWQRVEMSRQQMVDAVTKLRFSISPSTLVRGADSLNDGGAVKNTGFDRALAYRVYERLLAPFEDVLKDTRHIYSVTDGALTSLPLSLLVTQSPVGNDDDASALRATAWFAKRFAVTTLPSVTSLKTLRMLPEKAAKKREQFIGFGDPVLGGVNSIDGANVGVSKYFDGALANVEVVRSLASLPGTRRELKRIVNVFGREQSSILLGSAATETNVKNTDLSKASVVAFATHGLLTGELKGLSEPALVFTPPQIASKQDDGLLTASEVSSLNLSADWVILSACNTAAGDGTPGAEGLSGLAQAFLFAGARSILVSHWSVRDDATARLTVNTLKRVSDDPQIARAEALRLAMLDLLNDPTDDSLAHPSAWAAFIVVGDGGMPLVHH